MDYDNVDDKVTRDVLNGVSNRRVDFEHALSYTEEFIVNDDVKGPLWEVAEEAIYDGEYDAARDFLREIWRK